MRFIPTKIHGLLDYSVGILLIAMPWILQYDTTDKKSGIFITLGIAAILYSLFTDYEWSAYKIISIRIHLWIDFISGLILASSPWLMNFADETWKPHLIAGIFEMIVSLLTKTTPSDIHSIQNVRHRSF